MNSLDLFNVVEHVVKKMRKLQFLSLNIEELDRQHIEEKID